ncbi:MAG: glycosyltransferase [Lachnospiraceae bacterium]|nr:glycosyltransferase [Lachnospiraceae bacterium]
MDGIGVVVVTYNRLEKLKRALEAYEKQSKRPDYIVVVNNSSSDGTKEYIEQWKKGQDDILRYTVTLDENMGGSGGFYEGLKIAKGLEAKWIFVADDDAYADTKAIELLEKYIEKLDEQKISAICGSVWINGEIDVWHRRILMKKGITYEKKVSIEEYKKDIFEMDIFSYVGTALSKEALLQVGLPQRDYFIAYDDSEHSFRMRNYGKIYCVPAIKIVHDAEQDNSITWKTYYGIRNKIHAYKKHAGKTQAKIQSLYYLIRFGIKGKKERSLVKQAVYDAWQDNLGVNKCYKPGWKG